MVIAALGTVLAAGYLLWLYQRTAFGEPNAEFAGQATPSTPPATASLTVSVAHRQLRDDHDDDDGHGDHDDIHDVGLYEWLAWTPFLIAIVVFGVYPQLMFKIIDPAVIRDARPHEGLVGK